MIVGTSAFCCGDYSIQEVVGTHLDAIKTGDANKLKKAWADKGAQIVEIKNGNAEVKDTAKTFKLWTMAKNPNLNGKIHSVTKITKELAVAKVSLNWQGSLYTEILTLAKKGKDWKIINKTYEVPKSAKSGYGF